MTHKNKHTWIQLLFLYWKKWEQLINKRIGTMGQSRSHLIDDLKTINYDIVALSETGVTARWPDEYMCPLSHPHMRWQDKLRKAKAKGQENNEQLLVTRIKKLTRLKTRI